MASSSINIITGALMPIYPMNSSSRRFTATQMMRSKSYQKKENETNNHTKITLPHSRKLGISQDHDKFVYHYNGKNRYSSQNRRMHSEAADDKRNTLQPSSSSITNQKYALINPTKYDFDIITHAIQKPTNKQAWNQTKKSYGISKFTHEGRLFAPNYSNQHKQSTANPKNYRKQKNMCNGVCQLQKNYGTEKFFRKFK